jgi:hypothetical protein
MTINVTLNTVGNLQDTTTAQTQINNNSAAITGGFSTALNVVGDQMKGNLDMNSNQILNLPSPATANSPARLVDVVSNPTITVPAVGTSGAVVGLLNANNTWSGTQSFGAITATSYTGTTINATNITTTTLNVTGTSIFTGSVSLPLSAARIRQTGPSLFVNASTGSDGNTGGSATSAFSTITACVTYFQRNYDSQGATINIAAGIYNEQVQVESLSRGFVQDISFVGAGSSSVTVKAPNGGNCFFLDDYGTCALQGLTLSGSSSAIAAISCGQYSICDVDSDIVFGSFPLNGSVHVQATNNASINLNNSYTISGSVTYHMFATEGGLITANNGIVVTIPSSISCSTYAYAYHGGNISLTNYTATGSGVASTTGTKFFISSDGIITSGGFDINPMLPGSVSGSYTISGTWDTLTLTNTLTTLGGTSAVKGYMAVISDATATTPNTTVTGGGANTVFAWYNGSVWRILGS